MSIATLLLSFAIALCAFPAHEHLEAASTNLTLCVASSPTDPVCGGSGSGGSGGSGSSGGGGSGGGGSGGILPGIPAPAVSFEGIAYPGSTIIVLRNGQIAASVPASPDARFTVSLTGLSVGAYTFGVYAVDTNGVRSVLQTFSVSVTGGVSTGISGIFLPPTISIDKTSVKRGEPLTLFGMAAPSSTVTVLVNSETELIAHASTSALGIWRHVLDTTALEMGSHTAQAQSKLPDGISSLSGSVSFKVGTVTVPAKKTGCAGADLTNDCRVNIVDFSVLAFWYKRPLTEEAVLTVDLNHDGKVNIADFSILAYHWTG